MNSMNSNIVFMKPYQQNEHCSTCKHGYVIGACKGGYARACIWSDVAWAGSTDHWEPKECNEND